MKYYFHTLHDRLQVKKLNINRMLDLIPTHHECIEKAENQDDGENEYYQRFYNGTEYVRDYYFNKLNINKMDINKKKMKLVVKALGLAGMGANAKSVTLVVHMNAMVEEKGDDISLRDITELTQWIEEQYPKEYEDVPNTPT